MIDGGGWPTYVVLGRQGSGKGVQCERLAARFGSAHVSTGDALRAAVRAQTRLGRLVEPSLVRGALVADDLVTGIIADRLALARSTRSGVVLDGFPRTVAQADQLETLLAPRSIHLAIHLDVPPSVALDRLFQRRVCAACNNSGPATTCERCGSATDVRADDTPAAIGQRMTEYAREAEPLLAWFETRSLLATIDGIGTPNAVTARVAAAVSASRMAGTAA